VCSYGKQFSLTPSINIIAFVGVNFFWVICVCLFKSWGNKFDKNNVLKGSPFYVQVVHKQRSNYSPPFCSLHRAAGYSTYINYQLIALDSGALYCCGLVGENSCSRGLG